MTAVATEELDSLERALHAHFGFASFHKGQRAVIEDVLAGKPTMAVMPTGAGKSLCYQLPALLLDGVTVVVSPLIALMKDQVDSLRAKGIAAEFINSSQAREQQWAALDRLAAGETKLVYVAPERFRARSFHRALSQVPIALFAVDEAHCISRWGHDFRPDYVRLGEAVQQLVPERLLACTATATPDVREDITRVLGMGDEAIHVAGFLRSNLFLEARGCSSENDRERRLARFLREGAGREGSVIVYASTRKRVERYAEMVAQAVGGEHVVHYHGGLDDEARTVSQRRFMSGEARVAVATNAFGMGVDRADVRAVVHIDLPRTVEGYYQQVGRAGRDREPAHCLMLTRPNDTRVHNFLIDRGHPDPMAIAAVWNGLRGLPDGGSATPRMLAERIEVVEDEGQAESALRALQRVDAVRFDGRGGFFAHPDAPADPEALGIDFEGIARHRQHELNMLTAMKRLSNHAGCRHAYVLDYFGEAMEEACPGCDRCRPTAEGAAPGIVYEEPTEDEALVLKKALSGVARSEGRYGLRKVAAMLAGSRAKELLRTPLPRLSTYGLLKALGNDGCVELLQTLVDQDLCRIVGGEYPLLAMTERGWSVMRGGEGAGFRPPGHLVPGSTVARRVKALRGSASSSSSSGRGSASSSGRGRVGDIPQAPPTQTEPLSDVEALRIEALQMWRTSEASRRGVPPYVVFSNRTMFALATARPTSRDDFLAVPGLGPRKWDTYGELLVTLMETL